MVVTSTVGITRSYAGGGRLLGAMKKMEIRRDGRGRASLLAARHILKLSSVWFGFGTDVEEDHSTSVFLLSVLLYDLNGGLYYNLSFMLEN